MDEVRRTHPSEALEIPGLSTDGAGVDVGLIDIPVTFRGPLGLVASNLEHRSAEFFEENLRHVDGVLFGTFHDQMTLATVLPAVRPDGTPEISSHNLIFGVRREFREGRTRAGPLDLKPVLAALTRRLRVGLVA